MNILDKWIKKAKELNNTSCDIGYWGNDRVVEKAAAIEYGTARTDGKAFIRDSIGNNAELCEFAENAIQDVMNGSMTTAGFYKALADMQKDKIVANIDRKVNGEKELKEHLKTKTTKEKERGE